MAEVKERYSKVLNACVCDLNIAFRSGFSDKSSGGAPSSSVSINGEKYSSESRLVIRACVGEENTDNGESSLNERANRGRYDEPISPTSPPTLYRAEQLLTKTKNVWFIPKLVRKDAETLLSKCPDFGVFIVRLTSDLAAVYTITYSRNNKKERFHHVRLFINPIHRYFLEGSIMTFGTIEKLITHYLQHENDLKERLALPEKIWSATEQELSQFNTKGIEFWNSYPATNNSSIPGKSFPSTAYPEFQDDVYDNGEDEYSEIGQNNPQKSKPQPSQLVIPQMFPEDESCVDEEEYGTGHLYSELGPKAQSKISLYSPPPPPEFPSEINLNGINPPPKPPLPSDLARKATDKDKAVKDNPNKPPIPSSKPSVSTKPLTKNSKSMAPQIPDQTNGGDPPPPPPLPAPSSLAHSISIDSTAENNVYATPHSKLDLEKKKEAVYSMPPFSNSNEYGNYEQPWDTKPIFKDMFKNGPKSPVQSPGNNVYDGLNTSDINPTMPSSSRRRSPNPYDETDYEHLGDVKPGSPRSIEDDQSSIGEEFCQRIMPELRGVNKGTNEEIKNYILKLAENTRSTFSKQLHQFLQCTMNSKGKNPHCVMRNTRQFMSGMRNYLIKQEDFINLIKKEREKLSSCEFFNVDGCIEMTLQTLVMKPLRAHIKKLLADEHNETGRFLVLSRSMQCAAEKSAAELGVKDSINPPNENDLEEIKKWFEKMQIYYSPLKKLEALLNAIQIIYVTITDGKTNVPLSPSKIGADDFLPVFVYVLARGKFVSAEVETDYMEGLLQAGLLAGEGGYYLTSLQSAIQIIKSLLPSEDRKINSKSSLSYEATQGVIKVVILDENNQLAISKTFPISPNTTAASLCKMIANRLNVFDPSSYGLYQFTENEDCALVSNDALASSFPLEKIIPEKGLLHDIKETHQKKYKKPCALLYKRKNTMFALSIDTNNSLD